ncbi:MYB-like transcription factor ETC1 [Rhododendron vialii]|uniref:MYB-like transcription factor ETC1 n=1 Tax=Rhododendron vialii TaxID=182163 RepID=UPI00265F0198|nr:MYB-like transcription factor ETC1 [Rhododendron vialii]
MAESEHSSSVETSVNSQEESSTTSKEEPELAFSQDEETLVIRMYNLVGERWSLIAGRIPGRTAEQIEKYWNSRYATSR